MTPNVRHMPIDQITAGHRVWYLQQHVSPSHIAGLARSLRKEGLRDPVLVREAVGGDSFLLVTGRYRLEAAQLFGWSEVPVKVEFGSARTWPRSD